MRVAYLPAAFHCVEADMQAGETARLTVSSALGEHLVVFRGGGDALEYLRVTVRLTPPLPLVIPFLPRSSILSPLEK